MRALKVYGWASSRRDCPPEPNGSRQVRYIVAATSWRAAVAAVPADQHESVNYAMRDGSTTGNDEELAVALNDPGVAFWAPLADSYGRRPKNWRRA